MNRPRLEWFVQTAVQAQIADDVEVGRLYTGYRRFVDGSPQLGPAAAQLEMLNRYAKHYKSLVTGTGSGPIAMFGRRVAVWDASPTHPLALRVATSALTADEQTEIFACIESYLVRRAVCGLSRKNYNKVFQQQLKRLIDGEFSVAGLRETLAALSGEASRWPSDEEFRRELREGPLYPGRLDAAKLRSLFHRVETALRTEKSEERVPLALDALDIDHILPQSWTTYWPVGDGTHVSANDLDTAGRLRIIGEGLSAKTEAILRRVDTVPRLGNLTLVHYGLNRSVQNREFAVKREELFEHSNLHINRALMQLQAWDEEAIAHRGMALADVAVALWQGPELGG